MVFLLPPLILSKITTATIGQTLIMYQAVTGSLQKSNCFCLFFATPDNNQLMRCLPSFLKFISISARISSQVLFMAKFVFFCRDGGSRRASKIPSMLVSSSTCCFHSARWRSEMHGFQEALGGKALIARGRLTPWLYSRRSHACLPWDMGL